MLWINGTAVGEGPAGFLVGVLVAWAGLEPSERLMAATLAALVLARLLALSVAGSRTYPPAIIARAILLVILISASGVILSPQDRTAAWHAVFAASPPVMATVFGMTLGLALLTFLVSDQLSSAFTVAGRPARQRPAESLRSRPAAVAAIATSRGMEEAYLIRKILERTGDPAAAEQRIAHEMAAHGAPDRKTAIRYALYRLDDEERQATPAPVGEMASQPRAATDSPPASEPSVAPRRRPDNSKLFVQLRTSVMSDETAERLVAYEIRKRPGIDRKAAIRAAIQRLEWERSRD